MWEIWTNTQNYKCIHTKADVSFSSKKYSKSKSLYQQNWDYWVKCFVVTSIILKRHKKLWLSFYVQSCISDSVHVFQIIRSFHLLDPPAILLLFMAMLILLYLSYSIKYCRNTWWMFFTPPRSTRHSAVVCPPSDATHCPPHSRRFYVLIFFFLN